jgi:hypothetical protein
MLPHELEEKEPTLDTSGETFGPARETVHVNKYRPRKLQAFLSRQKHLRRRYMIVRAPYKKSKKVDSGFKMYYSEKEVQKSPNRKNLVEDENDVEDDDEVVDDPLKRKGFDL